MPKATQVRLVISLVLTTMVEGVVQRPSGNCVMVGGAGKMGTTAGRYDSKTRPRAPLTLNH